MSDWLFLFLVSGGLYLLECLLSLRPRELAVYTPITAFNWRVARAEEWFGNDRLGLSIGNPFVLRGSLVVPKGLPFSLSPAGITNCPPDKMEAGGDAARYVSFASITDVRSRFEEVIINGERFATVRSADWAQRIVSDIAALTRLSIEDREAQIRLWVSQRLDDRALAEDWRRFLRVSRPARVLATALLVLCYVVSPIAIFGFAPSTWKLLLPAVLLLSASTAVAHYRAHQKLYPSDRYQRWVQALSIVLYPPAGMRCTDKLSVDALIAYSPAIVLPFLCGNQAAMSDIRKYCVDIERVAQRPVSTVTDEADACGRWFGGVVGEVTLLAWQRMSVNVAVPPTPEDDYARSYCPRCHVQFREGAARCSDCDEFPLVSFARMSDSEDVVAP